MRLSLEECHQLVRQRMRSAQKTQKRNYDARKLRELAYHVGDILLKRDEATKVGYSARLTVVPNWLLNLSLQFTPLLVLRSV